MLASLTIKNIVLIDHLVINFANGLSALTGETGAGKSILLDSLGLTLGARSDSSLVRHGEGQASVSAVFDIEEQHVLENFFKDNDLEFETSLILRRILNKDGRSKAFVNDQPISIGLLKKIGEKLVEIHGQFDTHNLLNPSTHIDMLDGYMNEKDKLVALKLSYKEWKQAKRDLNQAQNKMQQAREEEEYLRSSLEDLDALDCKNDEEEKLTNLRDQLMRREQIFENLGLAQNDINQIETLSGNVWKYLERIGEPASQSIEAMERAHSEIQEVTASLTNLAEEIQTSEYSLEEIDDRLHALKAQARKHQCSIDFLPQKRDEIAKALNSIENEDQFLADLIKKTEEKKNSYYSKAQKISTLRKKHAKTLEQAIAKELAPLKLEKARFEIEIQDLEEDQWTALGQDQVRFLVATNPGAAAGALNKVASGGELSRLMLALKVVLAEVGISHSLVFDEVDSGIGGATAAAVGERLARLAQHRQILVVTHSPQVAAMAQHHWIVSKTGDKKLSTTIHELSQFEARQEEIARMLSGSKITAEARAAANKLLESQNIIDKKNVA